jgi:hypothetical protein
MNDVVQIFLEVSILEEFYILMGSLVRSCLE